MTNVQRRHGSQLLYKVAPASFCQAPRRRHAARIATISPCAVGFEVRANAVVALAYQLACNIDDRRAERCLTAAYREPDLFERDRHEVSVLGHLAIAAH